MCGISPPIIEQNLRNKKVYAQKKIPKIVLGGKSEFCVEGLKIYFRAMILFLVESRLVR